MLVIGAATADSLAPLLRSRSDVYTVLVEPDGNVARALRRIIRPGESSALLVADPVAVLAACAHPANPRQSVADAEAHAVARPQPYDLVVAGGCLGPLKGRDAAAFLALVHGASGGRWIMGDRLGGGVGGLLRRHLLGDKSASCCDGRQWRALMNAAPRGSRASTHRWGMGLLAGPAVR